MNLRNAFLALGLTMTVAATPAPAAPAEDLPIGLLVMAHGGSPDWNRAVEDAVAPLRGRQPVEIAFGMADRASLQEAVRKLEYHGASRIAVVRLFMSGHSFLHQTEFLLGMRPDAPAQFIVHAGHGAPASGGHDHSAHGHDHHGHDHGDAASDSVLARTPIKRRAEMALSLPGLDEDPAMLATILGERAKALSKEARKESVLLLGHGVEDDGENSKLLSRLAKVAGQIKSRHKFADVHVETLREDWRDKRAEAEQRIHDYLSSQQTRGRQVLVVPVRVHGFGPYREVLGESSYRADEKGLLPHPAITEWITRQYQQVCKADRWQGTVTASEVPSGSH